MNHAEVMGEIAKGVIHPLYVLYGTERILMQEIVDALAERSGSDEMNTLRTYFEDTPVQTVLLEAETLPFLADRRFVVLQNVSLFTGAKTVRSDHDPDAFQKYIENPSPSTVLVCTVLAEKLDERKKVTKVAHQNAIVVPCLSLKEHECQEWLIKMAKNMESSITKEAASRLILSCGTNLMMLRSELEKLSLYAGNQTIDEEMVEMLASRTIEQNVFVFVDEVVRLRTEQALRVLNDLIKMKESPVYLLFMIARQIRMMLQVKLQSSRGYSMQQVASQIGAHPYACKVAGEQANRYRVETLEALLVELADLDYKMKSGQISDRGALEMLILTLPIKVA